MDHDGTTYDGLGTSTGGPGEAPPARRRRRGTPRRRRFAVLGATLTAVVVALALMPGAGPAEARAKKRSTKPAAASTNWIVEQSIDGATSSVRLEWRRIKRAKTYEIDYVLSPSGQSMVGAKIQASKAKRTVRVRSTGGSIRTAVVGGLAPGRTYCFQVRGKNGKKFGRRGPAHCKVTVQNTRAPRAGASTMVVGTYNVCSAKCSRLLPWSARSDLTLNRIQVLSAGGPGYGRAVDVMAVQEGLYAVGDGGTFDRALAGSMTRGCLAPSRLTALYVRTSTYAIVPGTEGGIRFDAFDDGTHGACWVKVADRATGRQFAVVSVHLKPGDGEDAVRAQQMAVVQANVGSQLPGSTVVYTGDFNSSRSRPSDGPREVLAQSGYDDAYDQALRYLSPPMMNSATGEDAAVRKSWMWGDHIDRVFAPPNAAVHTWRVDLRTRDGVTYDTPMPSDHNPVVVELSLP